jgi:exodeoxyribonuclease VII small subunit
MEENLTYEAAYRELEQIYDEINNEKVSIDELATKVKRASVLINFCQEKLRSTELEINNIISAMPGSERTYTVPNINNSTAKEPDEDNLPF